MTSALLFPFIAIAAMMLHMRIDISVGRWKSKATMMLRHQSMPKPNVCIEAPIVPTIFSAGAHADYGYAIFRTGALADGRAAIDAALAGLREQIPSGDTPEFMRPLRALGEIARVQGDLATAMQAHRRWHELALKAYGPESRDAHQSAYQLSVDLTAKGDRASLLEAQSLIAKALVRGQADAEPMLPDYVRLQNTIVAAIEKLPMR